MKCSSHAMLLPVAAGFFAIGIFFAEGTALAQDGNVLNGPFELWEGVVVDPERGLAYTMSPDRAVEALELNDGKLAWSSKAAAKPLLAGNGRVVAQAEPVAANELNIVTLDAGKGEKIAESKTSLPNDVQASVDQTPQGQFVATGEAATAARKAAGGQALVTWTYEPKVLRGIRDKRTEKADSSRKSGAQQTKSGVLSVSLTDGKVTAAKSAAKNRQEMKSSLSSVRNRLDDKDPFVESVSADGRHIAKARSKEKDGETTYLWQITERATGKPIGEFEYNAAYTPFYVRDGVIYFQSVATEQGSGMTSEMGSETTPFSFRAVDLKSGNLLWSRPVRDTSYRGPLPP